MSNSNLEFRKVKSLYFLYEVNENGTVLRNVKSKRRIKIRLDMHHSKSGYYAAFVCIKGKVRRVMLHKVVAECWLGGCPEGMEVDHIDRNSHNNHYTNLRYVTHSEQMKNRVLSGRIIERAKANCLNYTMEYIAKPVVVSKGGENFHFPSMSQCAEYIAEECGKTKEHVRSKLKQRRKYIYGYEVIYSEMQRLDAATPRGKEQSNKYLVGTLDRFNDAKHAEVEDRVKHKI